MKTCATCNQPIQGASVTLDGKTDYHPEHLPTRERSFRETVRLDSKDVGTLDDFLSEAPTKERELR